MPVTTMLVSTGAAMTVTPNVELTVVVPAVAVAVIVAAPAPVAVTSPPDDTVATDGADVLQTTVASTVEPAWLRADAMSCSDCPTVSELPEPPAAAIAMVESTGAGLEGSEGAVFEPSPPPLHAARSTAPMAPNTRALSRAEPACRTPVVHTFGARDSANRHTVAGGVPDARWTVWCSIGFTVDPR